MFFSCPGRIRYSEEWWDKQIMCNQGKIKMGEWWIDGVVNECRDLVRANTCSQCMQPYLTVRVCKHPGEDFTQPLQLHPTAKGNSHSWRRRSTNSLWENTLACPVNGWPEGALVLQQSLEAQQPLLPLRPVCTGTAVQHLARDTNTDTHRSAQRGEILDMSLRTSLLAIKTNTRSYEVKQQLLIFQDLRFNRRSDGTWNRDMLLDCLSNPENEH